MKLSSNLTLAECCRSQTAKRLGIANVPADQNVVENLKAVAQNIFQPCREYVGGPLYVSSGYRSPELNTAIGGSKRSQHISGMALDLDADVFGGCTNAEIFRYIKENLNFDQLIWEFGSDENPDWVHVSFHRWGDNRKRAMRAVRSKSGGTEYQVILD
jgi:zinc D-Ala-D-Ala carboxypeptidase